MDYDRYHLKVIEKSTRRKTGRATEEHDTLLTVEEEEWLPRKLGYKRQSSEPRKGLSRFIYREQTMIG